MNYVKIMKFIVILTIVIASGCSKSNSPATELEGSWSTTCISGFTNFVQNPTSGSTTIVVTYKGNSTYTLVNNYADNNCLQLESSVTPDQSDLFSKPVDMPISFKIGKTFTSSNGVYVKEIDFKKMSGETSLSIYLLQDNGNTLYFGGDCKDTEILISCINGRPSEISSFSMYYSKIN